MTKKSTKQKLKNLSNTELVSIVQKLYADSKKNKMLIDRYIGNPVDEKVFIQRMKKETLDKVFNMPPKKPNGRTINSIISEAKKIGVADWVYLELELLAFKGFTDLLNEYGGSDENIENMAGRHLALYLKYLNKNILDKTEQEKLIANLKKYIQSKTNMYTDLMDDIFYENTGSAIERDW